MLVGTRQTAVPSTQTSWSLPQATPSATIAGVYEAMLSYPERSWGLGGHRDDRCRSGAQTVLETAPAPRHDARTRATCCTHAAFNRIACKTPMLSIGVSPRMPAAASIVQSQSSDPA